MEGLRTYSTVGVRPEADFFLWKITERYDDLLELGADLNGTPLAGWLTTPHSYLATTKPSNYTDKKRVRQGRVIPRNAPYLVVYPFVKLPALVLPAVRGARRGDVAARGGRRQVRHDHEPHDVLVRARRPGVHAGLRMRGAGGLHAPDDDVCARARRHAGRSATRRSSSASWSTIRAALDALDGSRSSVTAT